MFVGLTISNMEPENLANVLRRPLLSDNVQEVSLYRCFFAPTEGIIEYNIPISPLNSRES